MARDSNEVVAEITTAWLALKANEDERQANREAWPGLVIAFGKKLRAGREACRSAANGKVNDTEFGKWLKDKGVDYVKKDRRAAYINLAENEAKAMKVLQATTSKSIQIIWDEVDAWANPNKAKSKRIAKEKAAKAKRKAEGRKPKGQSLTSKLSEVKKKAREGDELDEGEVEVEYVACFIVNVLDDADPEVWQWLLKKADEIETEASDKEYKKYIEVQRPPRV